MDNINLTLSHINRIEQAVNNIFLIDDDGISNMINKEIIHIFDKSVNVSSHINAVKALGELNLMARDNAKNFPQVIFLDINMPVMDGWEFLDHFIKFPLLIQNKCAIHILTSSIDPDDIKRSQSYDMVKGFISKPLTITHLKTICGDKMKHNDI